MIGNVPRLPFDSCNNASQSSNFAGTGGSNSDFLSTAQSSISSFAETASNAIGDYVESVISGEVLSQNLQNLSNNLDAAVGDPFSGVPGDPTVLLDYVGVGASQRILNVLQTGGNTLNRSTANALNERLGGNLARREWGRALEELKNDLGLPGDHHAKIMSNGDYIDDVANVLGNLLDYVQ